MKIECKELEPFGSNSMGQSKKRTLVTVIKDNLTITNYLVSTMYLFDSDLYQTIVFCNVHPDGTIRIGDGSLMEEEFTPDSMSFEKGHNLVLNKFLKELKENK